jgi:hypothetical protein
MDIELPATCDSCGEPLGPFTNGESFHVHTWMDGTQMRTVAWHDGCDEPYMHRTGGA